MVRASKSVDSIDLGLEKKYNPIEVFVNSKKSDVDNLEDYFQLTIGLIQPCIDPNLAVC